MKTDKVRTKAYFRALCIASLAALLCIASLSGCISTKPRLMPEYTIPPEPTPEPTPTPAPTPAPTLAPTPEPVQTPAFEGVDAMGATVTGPEHYKRYISFNNVQVYEQCDDTFIDCIAENSYSETIVCAVEASFYEEAELVASSRLQMLDGQYLLLLSPGENTLIAQVNTDMRLTDLELVLAFDDALGVLPNGSAAS